MNTRPPLRVGLMDDDFFALKWNADLLTRDIRTTVCVEAETPEEFLQALARGIELDVALLDVEYEPEQLPLAELIGFVMAARPCIRVVCLSQYGHRRHVDAALNAGVRGFLLKHEIRMGIASALVQASRVGFLVTPGVLAHRSGLALHRRPTNMIHSWEPHPGLTPQLSQVFTLRVLYGMSAPMAAQEIHLATQTIEKYVQYAYQKLSCRWGDERYLSGIDLDDFPPEVQAFHRFTLPPIK